MDTVFLIWDIIYFPYLIIGAILLFSFSKKVHAQEKEVDRPRGILLVLFWPILYWIYTTDLRKGRFQCQEPYV